ncbi:hypothetical protein Pcinc_041125 [Petrolisthes cinctipes]|uniref:Uncharacterized protein n=1 Tax=Petrolisthes cinctipes TaxID=88211 RepID=A0AAE1EK46_PETCI|nr:hypothetical protein Pcinc_041125 [Petrolisthes cinctipes]
MTLNEEEIHSCPPRGNGKGAGTGGRFFWCRRNMLQPPTSVVSGNVQWAWVSASLSPHKVGLEAVKRAAMRIVHPTTLPDEFPPLYKLVLYKGWRHWPRWFSPLISTHFGI